MVLRSVAIWVILMVVAVANGVTRNALVSPRVGEHAGHVVSTVILCALIFLIALASIRWISPRGLREALVVGILWLVLTLAFEFLAGHYAFGHSWERLLADYNVAAGRVWVLVPIVSLLSPLTAAKLRGLQ